MLLVYHLFIAAPLFSVFIHKVHLGTQVLFSSLKSETVETGCCDTFLVLSPHFTIGKLVPVAGSDSTWSVFWWESSLVWSMLLCSLLHNAASGSGESRLDRGAPLSSCLGQPTHITEPLAHSRALQAVCTPLWQLGQICPGSCLDINNRTVDVSGEAQVSWEIHNYLQWNKNFQVTAFVLDNSLDVCLTLTYLRNMDHRMGKIIMMFVRFDPS